MPKLLNFRFPAAVKKYSGFGYHEGKTGMIFTSFGSEMARGVIFFEL